MKPRTAADYAIYFREETMPLHPSHQHYVAPVAEREAQSPGQHHGASSMNGSVDDLQAQFLAWLAEHRPAQHMRWRRGDYITERTWQEWHAQWRISE